MASVSKAIELVNERIRQDQGGIGNQRGMFENIIARKDIPKRTDINVFTLYNSYDNKKHLYGQQGGICNGCNDHFKIHNFEVDHIIAKSGELLPVCLEGSFCECRTET